MPKGQKVHVMLSVNEESREGECASCGTVPVVMKNMVWKCSVARRQQRGSRGVRRSPHHGLTRPERDAYIQARGGVCAICGSGHGVVIDHDHATGALRGALCGKCNRALGLFDDDVERMAAAIRYLSSL